MGEFQTQGNDAK